MINCAVTKILSDCLTKTTDSKRKSSSKFIIRSNSKAKVKERNHGETEKTELNPWRFLDDEALKKFLTDPTNNENAPDRKLVIDYLRDNFHFIGFLDVGCGPGHQYLALKQSGIDFNYLGVDKTQKMIDFARSRFPEAKFVEGDINKLEMGDQSWPIVGCRHVLEHLPGYEKALSELARVCSDCLIICLCKPLAGKQEIRVIGKPPEQTTNNEFSEHYLNQYARGPFMKTLKDFGFNVVVDKLVEVGGFFKNYELIIARRTQ